MYSNWFVGRRCRVTDRPKWGVLRGLVVHLRIQKVGEIHIWVIQVKISPSKTCEVWVWVWYDKCTTENHTPLVAGFLRIFDTGGIGHPWRHRLELPPLSRCIITVLSPSPSTFGRVRWIMAFDGLGQAPGASRPPIITTSFPSHTSNTRSRPSSTTISSGPTIVSMSLQRGLWNNHTVSTNSASRSTIWQKYHSRLSKGLLHWLHRSTDCTSCTSLSAISN